MGASSWFILLQALAGAPPSFDLAKIGAPDDCSSQSSGEILVCARQRPVPDKIVSGPPAEDAMPKAEIGLFGDVRGSLHGERSSVGGFISNRAMVTVAVPF